MHNRSGFKSILVYTVCSIVSFTGCGITEFCDTSSSMVGDIELEI